MTRQENPSLHKCECVRVLCVCTYMYADETMPVEFLYGEHEAGLIIKQGFYSLWSLALGPKEC